MSDFTKHKWKFDDSTRTIRDDDGFLIAVVEVQYGNKTNGRLIAAAPEMYKLISQVLEGKRDYQFWIKEAEALLARIDGEEADND
ncbi:MAG: hypothetical protein IJ859_09345 [Synergistaceae bacterium]|nr:hypothetical protein [Synergistaceae bacterium]